MVIPYFGPGAADIADLVGSCCCIGCSLARSVSLLRLTDYRRTGYGAALGIIWCEDGGSVYWRWSGDHLCCGWAAGQFAVTVVFEMATPDGNLCRLSWYLQSAACISVGWRSNCAMYGTAVPSGKMERICLSCPGKALLVGGYCRGIIRFIWIAFGFWANDCGCNHTMACKKALQTMEKFGTISTEISVR